MLKRDAFLTSDFNGSNHIRIRSIPYMSYVSKKGCAFIEIIALIIAATKLVLKKQLQGKNRAFRRPELGYDDPLPKQ